MKDHRCFPHLNPSGGLRPGGSPFEDTCEGPAITCCVQDHQGRLYAQGNGNSTRVNYCPFCGYEAPNRVEWQPPRGRRGKMEGRTEPYSNSWIANDFQYGDGFSLGHFCVIEPDVVVGHHVHLGHHVMLKSGTRIGNNVEMADYCCTTGVCHVGNNVAIRTGSTISKGVIVDNRAFIGAGIMSSHTKHIYHGRPGAPRKQYITRIGYGAVVGSRTNLMAGVQIAPGAVVGYNSNVVCDLDEPHGLYFNRAFPRAVLVRVIESHEDLYIDIPADYEARWIASELLKRYLPYA